MPASAFQAPLWTFYRRMDYLRQRKLQVFDPVVGFVVTLGLAVAGFGRLVAGAGHRIRGVDGGRRGGQGLSVQAAAALRAAARCASTPASRAR